MLVNMILITTLLSSVHCATVSHATPGRLMVTRPFPTARCAVPHMLYQRGADTGGFVDEDRVRSLIVERDRLRKDGDFDGADGVRAQLQDDHDVTLWDKDRVWMHGTREPPAREARAKPEGQQRRERNSQSRREKNNYGLRAFIENLSFECEWQDLKDHFIQAGYPIAYASVSYDREARRSKGHGIVQFETQDALDHALGPDGMTGTVLDGCAINVRLDAKSDPGAMTQRRGADRQPPPPMRGRDGGVERQRGDYATWGDAGYDNDDGSGRSSGMGRWDAAGGATRNNGGERRGEQRIEYNERPSPDERGGGRRIEYNEHGHDYDRHPEDGAALPAEALERVQRLLWQRLEAKLARDFGRADALLAELDAAHGVSVNDGSKQWRADGAPFTRSYARHGPAGGVDGRRVEALLV